MVLINKKLKLVDRIIVFFNALRKLIRGTLKICFFKESKFPFFLGRGTALSHLNHIVIGKNVKFEDFSEIHGLVVGKMIFGNNVTVGRGTMIRPSSYYGTGKIGKGLEIDDNSSIGPLGFIGCSGKIRIGKNVMIGPRVSMFAENHNFSDRNKLIKSQGVNNKGIIIEDNCWIGSGVIILDGVRIKSGSVIGAGTIVSKDISENSLIYNRIYRITKDR